MPKKSLLYGKFVKNNSCKTIRLKNNLSNEFYLEGSKFDFVILGLVR